MQDRVALGSRESTQPGDFGGYLKRNLSWAYRLATMALDDPIAAQEVVHDAAMEGWQAAGSRTPPQLDATFRRALDARCLAALRITDRATGDEGPLAIALLTLSAADRLALAMEHGYPEGSASERSEPQTSRLQGRVPARIRGRLEATEGGETEHGAALGSPLEARLRALYLSRDPGEEVPLSLRLRLQRSLFEAESAAAERDKIGGASGWGFAINTFMAILVLTLAIALASVINLRASQTQYVGSPGGPTTPLTITSVSVVLAGIDGPGVHVAASRDSFLAAFQGSSDWHPEPRQCLGDVTGLIDQSGHAQWEGQPVGHIEAIAADARSGSVFTTGMGEYCTLALHTSADGGATWAAGAPPAGATASPTWLAFDPANPGTLLTADGTRLFLSRDSGATWTNTRETVAPVGFDSTGRLWGWAPGELFESTDEGASWQQIGVGPTDEPGASTALPGGILLGEPDGLWWFPLAGSPSLVQAGSAFSIAPAGNGAVALGADSLGHPWLGTLSVAEAEAQFRPFALPTGIADLTVRGGQVAASSGGAVVAFAGSSSLIAFAAFAH